MSPFPSPRRTIRRALVAVVPAFAGLVVAGLGAAASPLRAQDAGADGPGASDIAPRSTLDGVYTFTQAKRGRDVFAGLCQSCHTATVHAEAPFRAKWGGRPLGELFEFISLEMPQSDPGTLSPREYLDVTAYLLRINGMPTGERPLTDDPAVLAAIRFDTLPASDEAAGER